MLKRISVLLFLVVTLSLATVGTGMASSSLQLTAKINPVTYDISVLADPTGSSILVRLGYCSLAGQLYPPGSIQGDHMCVDGEWKQLPPDNGGLCLRQGSEYKLGDIVISTKTTGNPTNSEMTVHTCFQGKWLPTPS